jgi:hypothetical protein
MSKPIGREEGHDRRGHHAIDHHRAHRYSGPPLGVVPPRCTTPASRNGVSGNWLEEPRPSSRRKYAPSLPFRAFLPRPARHLPKALDASLTRLGRSSVDLYQIHYPVPLISNAALMNRLAGSGEEGKTRAVGVYNYSARQLRAAFEQLPGHGITLASTRSNTRFYTANRRSTASFKHAENWE